MFGETWNRCRIDLSAEEFRFVCCLYIYFLICYSPNMLCDCLEVFVATMCTKSLSLLVKTKLTFKLQEGNVYLVLESTNA